MTFAVVGRPFHIPQGIARMWTRIVTNLPNKQARPAFQHGRRLWRGRRRLLLSLLGQTVEHIGFDHLECRLCLLCLFHLHLNPQVMMSDGSNLPLRHGQRYGNRGPEFPTPYVTLGIFV